MCLSSVMYELCFACFRVHLTHFDVSLLSHLPRLHICTSEHRCTFSQEKLTCKEKHKRENHYWIGKKAEREPEKYPTEQTL